MRPFYECHVTVEPMFGERLDLFEEISKRFNFKVAKLLLQRRKEDTPERSSKDSFATAHRDDLLEMQLNMNSFVQELRLYSIKVWRAKIEMVIVDQRFNKETGVPEHG